MALRGRLIHGWIIVMTQGLLDTGVARVARMSGAISGVFWFIPYIAALMRAAGYLHRRQFISHLWRAAAAEKASSRPEQRSGNKTSFF
jgi:hypothetical protein